MFAIGPYALSSQVLLAPMAGVTDLPFRRICRNMGAALTTSEMITSDVSLWNTPKSNLRLMDTPSKRVPLSIQIAGSDPTMMAAAAKHAVERGAQIVDINMGCPAKKVCKKLAGSALLKDERLVASILAEVVSAVDVPVTLKTRTGWDKVNRNGPTVARIAEEAGIQALTLHGRTRACRFEGNAEYETIAEVVNQVSIPVIANGDIDSPEKARQVIRKTGAAGVMVGRAAFGNPWIFEQISHYLKTGKTLPKPTQSNVKYMMEEHLKELYEFYGDYKGIRIARKHFAWYCQKQLGPSANIIKAFNQLDTSQSQLEVVKNLPERPSLYEEKVA